jgi:hypothetical protein
LSPAGGSDDEEDAAEVAALQGGEGRFADEAAVAAELKEMDEIYEVLAKVRRVAFALIVQQQQQRQW